MVETFSMIDPSQLIRPDFAFIVAILLGTGSVLKYKMALHNKLIPVILFCVAFVLASIWGGIASDQTGWAFIFDMFIIGGLSQGFATTGSAVFLYGSVHGTKRVLSEVKKIKRGEE